MDNPEIRLDPLRSSWASDSLYSLKISLEPFDNYVTLNVGAFALHLLNYVAQDFEHVTLIIILNCHKNKST